MTFTYKSSQTLVEENYGEGWDWEMLGEAKIRMFRHPNSVHDTVSCVHSARNVMPLRVFGSTIRGIAQICLVFWRKDNGLQGVNSERQVRVTGCMRKLETEEPKYENKYINRKNRPF